MKLNLYEIGQYTATKKYYIARLLEVSSDGTISRTVVKDEMLTEKEAKAVKKELESKGLKF